jgi:hypothetical protein
VALSWYVNNDPHTRHPSPMRRLLTLVPLVVLGGLTVAAALLSLHTAPRVAYFRPLTPGSVAVVSQFHSDVRTTLDAPNFQYQGDLGVINYQAPNRTQAVGLDQDVIIGRTAYLALSENGSAVTKWGRGPLVRTLNSTEGPAKVLWSLKDLLRLTSVTRHAGVFTAFQVVPADEVEPGLAGQVLIVFTSHTSGGYITSVRTVFHGFLPTLANLRGGRIKYFTTTKLSGGIERYSKFGQIPPITAPRSNIIQLRPCPQKAVLLQSGPHACGL